MKHKVPMKRKVHSPSRKLLKKKKTCNLFLFLFIYFD